MIYRKWSLLSSTAVITGGIISAVVVANLFVSPKDSFLKPELKKENESLLK